jgi:hypothetical protein
MQQMFSFRLLLSPNVVFSGAPLGPGLPVILFWVQPEHGGKWSADTPGCGPQLDMDQASPIQ